MEIKKNVDKKIVRGTYSVMQEIKKSHVISPALRNKETQNMTPHCRKIILNINHKFGIRTCACYIFNQRNDVRQKYEKLK